MKKMKVNLWYWIFYMGTLLESISDWMENKGLDKLEDLTRDSAILQYARKRGMIL